MICENGNVNTVEHIKFPTDFHVFLASILNSVCLTVSHQWSSWSTQLPRKADFVFKANQSVHCVCYACTDQDFHLYLSHPSLH